MRLAGIVVDFASIYIKYRQQKVSPYFIVQFLFCLFLVIVIFISLKFYGPDIVTENPAWFLKAKTRERNDIAIMPGVSQKPNITFQ